MERDRMESISRLTFEKGTYGCIIHTFFISTVRFRLGSAHQ